MSTVVANLAPKTETLVCEECNGIWTREVRRGHKPRWCRSCSVTECEWCGTTFPRQIKSKRNGSLGSQLRLVG